ncbi:histidine phosphatase family protein [Ornithinibacillus californiensis]|uniref:histidine phosphatase family protein n=1 Tax=Ornithinibacillus californiensis TaxID=161536 RepID=UPI00064E0C30|nr:histidine phosphatase family protein [Ornithinibacillus californiensis]
MGKKIYILRHCQAEGQELEAKLTVEGLKQAQKLVDFFSQVEIDRIISSPYHRAKDSVAPLAKERGIPIETDHRLSERVLSTEFFPDWRDKLKQTFVDIELAYEGGESSRQTMDRGLGVISDILDEQGENVVIATHGGLTSMVLKYYQPSFSFEDWENLSNPDVYLLDFKQENPEVNRIWK